MLCRCGHDQDQHGGAGPQISRRARLHAEQIREARGGGVEKHQPSACNSGISKLQDGSFVWQCSCGGFEPQEG